MPAFQTPQGSIYFERRGSRADPPILMINSLGCQNVHCPESWIEGLRSEGFRVLLMDIRGAGLRTIPSRHYATHSSDGMYSEVYWTPMYEFLKRTDFEVLFVEPGSTERPHDRKSGVFNCQ